MGIIRKLQNSIWRYRTNKLSYDEIIVSARLTSIGVKKIIKKQYGYEPDYIAFVKSTNQTVTFCD